MNSYAAALTDATARTATITISFIEYFSLIFVLPFISGLTSCVWAGGISAGQKVHGNHDQDFLQGEIVSCNRCDLPHNRLTVRWRRRIYLEGKSHAKTSGTCKC
jgi:hypothetical protein